MALTTLQKTVLWHAARGRSLTLTGAEVAEIANRESELRASLAEAQERIDQLTAANDVLRAIVASGDAELRGEV